MTTNPSKTILVMTHLPDRESAERMAESLVEQRLAACVNIHAACTSIYHWQGKIERSDEIPLHAKTTLDRYDALEAAIRAMHPYELPEIVHVHLDGGEHGYIQWIEQETRA
ncbi:MAG TPA: divalent-cation tolerance protein CutA [Methylophilaceae bacterium]|jgi:periplasmic divalent cation tolerance protein